MIRRYIRSRGLLGARQSHWSAGLLRRGQALCRDPVFRLSPPARLRVKVARIFNSYGPRMHPNDGRVVSNFILQALRNEPITLFGDGQQTRSFCYVADMVDGLLRLMDTPDEVVGPVNLGNPGEFTMRDLAERIIALTGTQSTLVNLPLPEDDPRHRQPDICLARDLLGWEPGVQLDEGLARTIDYFSALSVASK